MCVDISLRMKQNAFSLGYYECCKRSYRADNMTVTVQGSRKIGAAFLSSREVTSQECISHCMPELWLRKIFAGTACICQY